MDIKEKIDSLPKALMFVVVILGLGIVFFFDIFSGNELSFSILYLIPISICLWYIGKWEAIVLSVVSAVLWFIGENRNNYSSETIAYWNAFVRLGFFCIVVFLLDYIKQFNMKLEDIIKLRTKELTVEVGERKKAEEEVKNMNRQLSQLAINIQKDKEKENMRVAREIHDELGQVLTALKIDTSWFKANYGEDKKVVAKVNSMSEIINDTINTVRRISTNLRPRLLDELGLMSAIEMHVREFQTKSGIRCNLDLPMEKKIIDEYIALNIFRIFQEAMTNIARHSQATHVNIKLDVVNNDRLIMSISDNGVGITSLLSKDSLGIIGMIERVKVLGGVINFEKSEDNIGTVITVEIPLNQKVENK